MNLASHKGIKLSQFIINILNILTLQNSLSVALEVSLTWVKVPRNENPEKGRGSWGPPRPPCGSRAKPWWGTRGRSPRKLLDFSNLNTPKTAQKLRKHKGKLTTFFLDMMSVIYFFFSYPSNRLFFLQFCQGHYMIKQKMKKQN